MHYGYSSPVEVQHGDDDGVFVVKQAAGVSGDEDDERGGEEEKVEALPRKAGNPLLSKK